MWHIMGNSIGSDGHPQCKDLFAFIRIFMNLYKYEMDALMHEY
jgi:hypothetical protein